MARTLAENTVWSYKQSRRVRGVDIVCVIKSAELPLKAMVGRTVFVSNIVNQARVEFGERDYLVLVSEFVDGFQAKGLDRTEIVDGVGTPIAGLRIKETIDGQALTFEAMAPNAEPEARFSDPTRQVFRIHCKRVE